MATITAPTFNDLFNLAKSEAANRRPELTFDEGDISEFYAVASAAMADHLIGYLAQRVKETFLDGAEDDALTTLADDRYNIQRMAATQATGTVAFTRSVGTLVGTIPAGTVVSTQTNAAGVQIQFTTDTDLGFNSGDLSKTVNVTAAIAGSSGSVAAGTVTAIVTSGLFDTFTCTNAAQMAGGNDGESDDSLRQRCRDYVTTLRRGTLAALEYGALTISGVTVASAVEPGDGTVTVYVSDATGASSPGMISAVAAEMINWRAGGVVVNVAGGQVYSIAGGITLTLTTKPGVNSSSVAADIQNAIVARVNKLGIGDTLSATQIKQAVASVDPDGITDVTITNPVGTVDPGPSGLIRITASSIVVS